MEWIKDVLIILLPGLVVLGTVYFLMKQFFENQMDLKRLELRKESMKAISPQQMQAYERVILLLERLHPEHLVMRSQKQGMSAIQLQSLLLKSIRQEFDHNLAQQLYISAEAWSLVKRSKEETVRLINLAATKSGQDSSALDLSQEILAMASKLEALPTEIALNGVKKEFRAKFG